MNEFTSNLKPLMEDFLDFKHALGIKYHTGRFYLEQLDKYNACHTNEKVLTREIAEGWANNLRLIEIVDCIYQMNLLIILKSMIMP